MSGKLEIESSCLVVIDIQGKLAQLMHEKEILFKNVCIMIEAAKILDIPIVWCQQVPEALGATVPQIAELLTDNQPIDKACFSCCLDQQFTERLIELDRNQILITGIETHICVYQTARDLLGKGYDVTVIADAVSSRTLRNSNIALSRLQTEGVKISSTEMGLFELLKTAEHSQFKKIAKLVK
ncbi:MAG: hydrolase [Planctomycetota bacterium]|jgi:nicotinamidase-related amidase